MRTIPRPLLVSVAALLATAGAAQAHIEVYTAVLSGPAEAPPNASPGTGFATVTFDLDLATMRVEATFSQLLGTTTAAHTHGPTALPGVGTAGVMTVLPSYIGFPLGVTVGAYDHTYDLTLASSYSAGFITSSGGTVALAMNRLIQSHRDGTAYFNVHSSVFPGGEIRGFLVPAPGGGLAMLCAGGLIAARRRRG